jgi:hypothetical protein
MLALALLGCTHLPPHGAVEPAGEAAARARVEACVAAHGGLEAFYALGDVEVRVEDVWSSARIAPEQPGTPQMVYTARLNKGVVRFAEVDEVWGWDSVQAWALADGAPAEPPRPAFVPSYGYFFALPFKFLDPGLRYLDVGRRTVDGVEVDEVLVGFEEPLGAESDLYLLRIDAQTHELRSMLFTFRDMGRIIELEAAFQWQALEGVRVPQRLDITLVRPLERPMHSLTFAAPVSLEGFDPSAFEKP